MGKVMGTRSPVVVSYAIVEDTEKTGYGLRDRVYVKSGNRERVPVGVVCFNHLDKPVSPRQPWLSGFDKRTDVLYRDGERHYVASKENVRAVAEEIQRWRESRLEELTRAGNRPRMGVQNVAYFSWLERIEYRKFQLLLPEDAEESPLEAVLENLR